MYESCPRDLFLSPFNNILTHLNNSFQNCLFLLHEIFVSDLNAVYHAHFIIFVTLKFSAMEQTTDIRLLNEKIEKESAFVDIIRMEMNKVIVGQKHLVDSLLIGLLANGHLLLEGVPGLAKTLAIKSLASIIDAKFSRIQFTPDLLPADLIGTMIYSQKKEEFIVKKGPVFANFILADEINRSPAKVQSALLEAMQERQITIGESTYKLEEPFLVLATQNPIEQEGTYPLPEAQVDRFMLKVLIGYPTMEEEKSIVRENLAKVFPNSNRVLKIDDILRAKDTVREVYMDEKIENYILNIVFASRDPEKFGIPQFRNMISYGASPRASINLALASKAFAFIKRRGYVIPEDVRAVCADVMRHRIGLTYEAEAENVSQDHIISEILNVTEVP
jgi:MoxR-like ATPase